MEHPIMPPPELVAEWLKQFYGPATRLGTLAPGEASLHVATAAAQWGADQELEACCAEVSWFTADKLRAARRPKTLSDADQALEALNQMDEPLGVVTARRASIIRRALERLKKLEALPND